MKNVVIEWSYPKDIENILCDDTMQNVGLYYITRNFGGNISDLYIGKTIFSYKSRLEPHCKSWIDDYRGVKQVRLGEIVSHKSLSWENYSSLIDDVEKTLIWLMRDSLLHNIQCTKDCYPKHRLHIANIGYRGNLPSEMFFTDEEWYGE